MIYLARLFSMPYEERFKRALRSLSFRQRELFKLRSAGYTVKQASHIFKTTVGRIRSIEAKTIVHFGRWGIEIGELIHA